MQSLLEKSLLRRRGTHPNVRYWMLTTIADYALEKLALLPDRDDVRLRHAEWYRDQAVAVVGIPGPHHPRAAAASDISRFAEDYANTRMALSWAWSTGRNELAIEIGVSCCRYWLGVGAYPDATAWLETALPKVDTVAPLTQLHALEVAGVIAFFISADGDRADEMWARAGVIANELGLDDDAAWLDHRRASVAWDRGDIESAVETMKRLLAFHQQRGNHLEVADSLHHLGEARRDLGNYDEAEQDLLAADSIYREVGDGIGLANNSHSLADLALDRGQYTDAINLYHSTLSHASTEAGRHEAYCLAGIASGLAATGRDDDAATLWGAVCNAERTLGFRMVASERRRYEGYLSRLEQGDSWAHGQTLNLQEAVDSLPAVLGIGERQGGDFRRV
jgi:tetratricopeptide (TPR) repeat protein